jgi:hypothetical protein
MHVHAHVAKKSKPLGWLAFLFSAFRDFVGSHQPARNNRNRQCAKQTSVRGKIRFTRAWRVARNSKQVKMREDLGKDRKQEAHDE